MSALPPTFRFAVLAAPVLVVAVSVAAAILMHPAQAPLFAQPLAPDQVTEVEGQLAQWNVAFTPALANVTVSASRRNAILLRLSLAGIPHPHLATTNEALANVGVLTPQAVIDAQTRSGLAGEIALSLRSVDGVDDATVIIAPAKPAEFADESATAATASVRLHLHAGARLSASAIAGIRGFVAASVAGLDPAKVTILDDRGVAMGEGGANGDDEETLQKSLQAALDQALGAGSAIVRVHVEYGQTSLEVRDRSRAPAGPIVRETTSESFDGQGRRYAKNDERDDRGSVERESVSRTGSGAIVRISTAVLIDTQSRVSLPTVRAIASAAVGFDPKRGDVLTVQTVDFHRPRQAPHDLWFLLYGLFAPLLPTLAIVLGALVFARAATPHVITVVRQLGERASIAKLQHSTAAYSPSVVRGALAHEPPHAAAAILSALPAATAAAVLELYPQAEREAIVLRMQRAHSPLIPDLAEVLGDA